MKKIFATLLVMCAIVGATMAQPRAIGARVGSNLEFSYQHTLAGGKMMMDLTAGIPTWTWRWSYIDVNAIFDWVFNINGGWNWYVGPGAGLGVSYASHYAGENLARVRLNVGGQIGVEYQFGIPLNLSLDWRPMVNVLSFGNGYYHYGDWYNGFYSVALGIRYRF